MHRILLAVLLCLFSITVALAQSLPVLNGSAIRLPRPAYEKEFVGLCAYGKVSIKVVVDRSGLVEEATPIFGDPILFQSAVAAATKAKFRFVSDLPRIKHTGLIVYNFPSKRKCIDGGVLNKKAISLPSPDLSKIEHLSSNPIIVEVRIIVDILSGEVKSARAYSGNIIYRAICEKAAASTKFSGGMIDGLPVDVKGTLVYRFRPDGSLEY